MIGGSHPQDQQRRNFKCHESGSPSWVIRTSLIRVLLEYTSLSHVFSWWSELRPKECAARKGRGWAGGWAGQPVNLSYRHLHVDLLASANKTKKSKTYSSDQSVHGPMEEEHNTLALVEAINSGRLAQGIAGVLGT